MLCVAIHNFCLSNKGQEASKSDERDDTEMRQFYQSRCRRAARAVIEFVTSLQQHDLDAFWLPCKLMRLILFPRLPWSIFRLGSLTTQLPLFADLAKNA
jgi:hypothetical protein